MQPTGYHHGQLTDEKVGKLSATGNNQKNEMERRELTHVTTVVRNVPVRSATNGTVKDNTQDYISLKKTLQSNVNSFTKRKANRIATKDAFSKLEKQRVSASCGELNSSSDNLGGYQKVLLINC